MTSDSDDLDTADHDLTDHDLADHDSTDGEPTDEELAGQEPADQDLMDYGLMPDDEPTDDEPTDHAPADHAPADHEPTRPVPRPISIWRPVEAAGGLVWRRPEASALGDHHARRREIRHRPAPGVRRVAFFGESAAAGYLLAPHLTPAGVLEDHLNALPRPPGVTGWEVVDLARTNERSAGLAATVEAAAQLAPEHLLVFSGNNPKLLDTPELSPYAPATDADGAAARREMAAALRDGGPPALARLARRRWAGELAASLQRVAAVAVELSAEVTVVLPEVNLADWETAQPPVRLPGDGSRRWFSLLAEARRALAEGDAPAAEAAAWQMTALDDGLCPTPFRLLAAARQLAAGNSAMTTGPRPAGQATGASEARGSESLGRDSRATDSGATDSRAAEPRTAEPTAVDPAANVTRAAAAGIAEAARSELEATHYPLLANLAAPQADEVARRVLSAACRHHRFAAVDLRAVFAAHTGSPLPGLRLFLDYCHLTAEGVHVAMAAVAASLVRSDRRHGSAADPRAASKPASADGRWEPPELSAVGLRTGVAEAPAPSAVERQTGAAPGEALPRPALAAAAEATAWLGAAVHTAHRHLPVTNRRDLLHHACRRALELDPDGAAASMVDLAAARFALLAGGGRAGTALPALLTAGQERQRRRPAPLLVQHGWRWPHLDGDLLRVLHAELRRAGRWEADQIEELLAHSTATAPEDAGPDLVHPPLHLAHPVARPLPDALAPEGLPPRAYLRSVWPETAFDYPDPDGRWRRLRVVARRAVGADAEGGAGRAAGTAATEAPGDGVGFTGGADGAASAARVWIDGRSAGEVPLGGTWSETTIELPPPTPSAASTAAASTATPSTAVPSTAPPSTASPPPPSQPAASPSPLAAGLPGLRRLTIAWPPLPDAGPRPLDAAIERLDRGLNAELHPGFGDLFSLHLLP